MNKFSYISFGVSFSVISRRVSNLILTVTNIFIAYISIFKLGPIVTCDFDCFLFLLRLRRTFVATTKWSEHTPSKKEYVSQFRALLIQLLWRCPWCNGYRRRKWTRRHEFKSSTRLIAFHIALIPLGKIWIQLFSLKLWVNSRTDWFLQPWWGNYSRRRNTLNSNLLNSA